MGDLSTKYEPQHRQQEQGKRVELTTPSQRRIGLAVVVVGPDSKRKQEAIRAAMDRRQLRPDSTAPLSEAERDAENVRVLADCILSWEFGKDEDGDDLTWKGERPVYTPELGVELLTNPTIPWVRDQVAFFANSRPGFFGG